MRISYAVPVCYEHEELKRLLTLLIENKREEDEIVVQCDMGNTTPEVYKVLYDEFPDRVTLVQFPLSGNFSAFKNNLKSQCKGDWVVQIDADEMLNPELVKNMHEVLGFNQEVEVFFIPRINTVEGLTADHVKKWRWNVDINGWVNFPDYQMRILKNLDRIYWVNKVHERIVGHTAHAYLPMEQEYCILHHKSISRQEAQNQFYQSI